MDTTTSPGATLKSASKPSVNSPVKPKTSAGTRRRVYHCLTGPQGFLLDHSNVQISDQSPLWTDNAADSLRFLVHDKAAARLQQLRQFIPELTISLVSFQYAPSGVWTPAND